MLRDGADGVGPIPTSRWDAAALRNLDIPRRGGFLEASTSSTPISSASRPVRLFSSIPSIDYSSSWRGRRSKTAAKPLSDGPERLSEFSSESPRTTTPQLQAMQGGASDGYRITGCAASIAANRISHYFDFRGPSLAIDTACSSSLVAVDLACRSLWDGESDLAMAGGVNLILLPEVLASFTKAGFLSAEGQCKTFDAQADGYVRGEGAGMVVLKPLSRAVADGDRIYAVIRGGAINQDGRTNGLTAPNRKAQEAVLRARIRTSRHLAGSVGLHRRSRYRDAAWRSDRAGGAGAVLAEGRGSGTKCSVGSVKTNIGHLEAAAGIAGLIKTALAIHHRAIPPTLHFSEPNPHVAFDALPLRVQVALESLPENSRPAIAGVSSFGFGGTNAHLVLEEAHLKPGLSANRTDPRRTEEIVFPLSAKSPAALLALACSIRDALSGGSCDADLRDLAYTAGARRGHHDHRLAIVAASRDEIIEALDSFRRGEPHVSSVQGRKLPGRRPRLAFVFSGEGKLASRAPAHLFRYEPAFRTAIEQCDAILSRHLGWSPAAELGERAALHSARRPRSLSTNSFALQLGLAALWKSWGIVPDRLLGDGIGEVAAAYLAGNLRLEDAARIAAGPDRETAPFAEKIAEPANDEFDVFLELGRHPVLASTIKACVGARARSPLILASLQRGDSGAETLLCSAAFLYANGFDLEWSRVSPPGRFVRLPSYPWQRERFWLDDKREPHQNGASTNVAFDDSCPTEVVPPNGMSNGHHAVPARDTEGPGRVPRASWAACRVAGN